MTCCTKKRVGNRLLWCGSGSSTEPGRQALTGSGGLRYAAKILYEIMLAGFLYLTKPAFMRRPWRITPCPSVHGWAFLCFVGIISTVSRQLRYSPSRACERLPPGFLTLWLNLPSCRFAYPSITSSVIIRQKPTINAIVARFECPPSDISGTSSSMTT